MSAISALHVCVPCLYAIVFVKWHFTRLKISNFFLWYTVSKQMEELSLDLSPKDKKLAHLRDVCFNKVLQPGDHVAVLILSSPEISRPWHDGIYEAEENGVYMHVSCVCGMYTPLVILASFEVAFLPDIWEFVMNNGVCYVYVHRTCMCGVCVCTCMCHVYVPGICPWSFWLLS